MPERAAEEQALWSAVLTGEKARDAGQRLGIAPKRVEYLCEKWSRKGIYDYGVCCDLGWNTAQAERSSLAKPAYEQVGGGHDE